MRRILSPAEAAKASHVAQHQSPMSPPALVIAKAAQNRRDPLATFVCTCSTKRIKRMGVVQNGAHLIQGADFRFVQIDDHPEIINHPHTLPPIGSQLRA